MNKNLYQIRITFNCNFDVFCKTRDAIMSLLSLLEIHSGVKFLGVGFGRVNRIGRWIRGGTK